MPSLPSSPFQLDQLDLSPLKGKVIVIDPGHGGKYSGAVGKMGLKESEVNLGVALYLWGALQSAGAKPVMTRTADTTVASPAHKQLRADLLARSMVSNTVNPDLFVSIHHTPIPTVRKRTILRFTTNLPILALLENWQRA